MYNLEDIKILHLEVTERCQAACPQCGRTGVNIKQAELQLEDCKKLFSIEFIQQLEVMYMCGNFGDPIIATDTLEIFEYFKSVNPNINLRMVTNGGARDTAWWEQIAKVVDVVTFSIDGLNDTNHLYRKNVIWNKVIENARTYITNGGYARWDYLIFEHNKHQVEDAEALADMLGFKEFVTKETTRGKALPKVPKGVECKVQKERSIYVSAEGKVMPCCWIGSTRYKKEWQDWNNEFDAARFKDIIDSPLDVCKRKCSIYYKPYESQFIDRKYVDKKTKDVIIT
jgi:MoaA/NifB/PqqE/SkfB family radical SAM enzyme